MTDAASIRISPEFQRLIPPLSPDEKAQLAQNILRDGCREPLVVWNGVLVDGHNRYEICTKLSVPFQTTSIEFANEEEAADWIDANQLGRRNLSPDQASLLRGRRYNRAKQPHGGQTALLSGKTPRQANNTRLNWSARKLGLNPKKFGDRPDDHVASPLFFDWQWPEPFRTQYENARTPMKRAKIAAARIEHLIKTKGAE